MKVVFLPAARADILSVVEYLLEQYAYDAAERFPDSVEAAATDIARHPHAGAPSLRDLRTWVVKEFPKVRLYYAYEPAREIRIVRVLHTARDLPTSLDE